ncbi:MAG: hypothetical protein QW255_04810 [Candidatus Bilamarchaeaceae archaeon]
MTTKHYGVLTNFVFITACDKEAELVNKIYKIHTISIESMDYEEITQEIIKVLSKINEINKISDNLYKNKIMNDVEYSTLEITIITNISRDLFYSSGFYIQAELYTLLEHINYIYEISDIDDIIQSI